MPPAPAHDAKGDSFFVTVKISPFWVEWRNEKNETMRLHNALFFAFAPRTLSVLPAQFLERPIIDHAFESR